MDDDIHRDDMAWYGMMVLIWIHIYIYCILVGGFNHIEFILVNGKEYPIYYINIYILWKIKAVFETTNQYTYM